MMNTAGVIIRLQKLPLQALSSDIREFFHGLRIPDGGVHIVGGKEGDAFIAFSTDEDGRQAMRMDGKRLKGWKIKLYLSSRMEMQQIIEKARLDLHHANDQDEKCIKRARNSPVRERPNPHPRRRSRSRSPDRNRGKKIDIPKTQPPPAPVSGFASFKKHSEPEPQFVPRGVLDRHPNPMADQRFHDRGPVNFQRPPQMDLRSPEMGMQFGRPPQRVPEPFNGSQLIRPGIMAAPFNNPRFNMDCPPFNQGPIPSRMPFNFDNGPDFPPDRPPIRPPDSFITQEQINAARASRRSLLPPPPEDTQLDGPNLLGDRPAIGFAQNQPPFGNRPPPIFDLPFKDWTMDNGREFQFNGPPPTNRPTLLPMHSTAPARKELGLCVSMTAVPSSRLRYGSIREFYHPLNLEGPDKIKIVVDERGQRTGQVYCKFMNLEDAETALTYTGREKIYIRMCPDEEFEKAVDGGLSKPRSRSKDRERADSPHKSRWDESRQRPVIGGDSKDGYVLEVSNIPYRAIQRDLKEYFARYNASEIRRLYKHHNVNGKVVTSDTAFVVFGNERDMMAALRAQDRRLLDRDLRLIQSSTRGMDETFSRHPQPPPEAMEEWSIVSENRDKNANRDKSPRRSRSPRRYSPPQSSYSRQWSPQQQRPMATSAPAPLISKMDAKEMTSIMDAHDEEPPEFTFTCICMNGVALNATNRDVASFFAGSNIAPNGIRILKTPPGVAYVEFVSTVDCENAKKKDKSYIGTRMVTLTPCTKEDMMDAIQKQIGTNGGNGQTPTQTPTSSGSPPNQTQQFFPTNAILDAVQESMDTDQADLMYLQIKALAKQEEEAKLLDSQRHELPDDDLDVPAIDPDVVRSIGIPGCVAALHNLSPGITLEEICQIFQGNQLLEDSIRMHYSNTGEATGDCLLAFATPKDAQTAASAMNGTVINGKKLRMYVPSV